MLSLQCRSVSHALFFLLFLISIRHPVALILFKILTFHQVLLVTKLAANFITLFSNN